MRKALLTCILTAALLLSGCVVVSSEEFRHARRFHGVCPPPHHPVRVVPVPCPPPQPHRSHILR